ncbi:hypothetical protein UFOVP116_168 [uncultured Caudovirales phage]|uniref:Uncharacterized protein n=1 Tax=uncultured Caudovirales phage TaxID=2100421 RepID=A0A6J5LA13_9CAUD|nr:hypothetical protein UFOVP116_168 [uncultured Caudovirales phage]
MNKRIQELAINCAGQLDWDSPKDPESFTFSCHELEKFAELIVKECVVRIQGCNLVEGYDPNRFDDFERDYQRAINKAASQVLLHFGVE